MPKCLRTFPPPPCPNEVAGGGFCDEHKPIIQNRTTFEIPRDSGGGEEPPSGGGGGWVGNLEPPEPSEGGRGGGYGGGGPI